MKDLGTKEQFIELRAQGFSYAHISEKIGVSKPTLIKWSRDLEDEINNLHQIHLESVREKYKMQKISLLEVFGKQMQNIEAELSKRNLNELKTEQLFNLWLKMSDNIAREDTQPIFKSRADDLCLNQIQDGYSWRA